MYIVNKLLSYLTRPCPIPVWTIYGIFFLLIAFMWIMYQAGIAEGDRKIRELENLLDIVIEHSNTTEVISYD